MCILANYLQENLNVETKNQILNIKEHVTNLRFKNVITWIT